MWLVQRLQDYRQLVCGVVIGIAFTTVLFGNMVVLQSKKLSKTTILHRLDAAGRAYMLESKRTWNNEQEERDRPNAVEDNYGDVNDSNDDMQNVSKSSRHKHSESHEDDDTEARALVQKIRVLCIIMTMPLNLDIKAVHVRDTWGKRCTRILFFSSEWNQTVPTIGLNVSEGRDNLTQKHNQAFKYVADHHADKADWFLKADDDTYVIMENLRHFLSSYDAQEPICFGQIFRPYVKQGYPAGGSGVVLSKEAFRRFTAHGFNESLCRQHGPNSDLALGQCMEKLGVQLLPTLNAEGKTTFHSFDTEMHVHGRFPDWYSQYDPEGAKKQST